jgi:hypothetical protein
VLNEQPSGDERPGTMLPTGVVGIGSISCPVASGLLGEGFQVVVTGHVFSVHDGQVVRP